MAQVPLWRHGQRKAGCVFLDRIVGGLWGLMRRSIPCIACHLMVWCSLVGAQEGSTKSQPEPGAAAAMPSAEAESGGVTRGMDVWLVDPKTGNREMRVTPEEIEEILRAFHESKEHDRPPRFSLQSISVTGKAKENLAELAVQFEALVRDRDNVRIPLHLDEALLLGGHRYEGPGQTRALHYDEGGDGYVWFLLGGTEEQSHKLTLQLWVPLSHTGDRIRMRLSVPRAAKSGLDLTVPISNAVVEVSGGQGSSEPPSPGPDGSTLFKVGGLDRDFELTWYESDSRRIDPQPVLEAVAKIAATIDSDTVTTTARLTVRSENPFNRFQVRLPPGAVLDDDKWTGYTVVPLPRDSKPAQNGAQVEVKFPKYVTAPPDVVLRTTQARESTEFSELAGFDVIEAVQQRGIIAVVIDDDWAVFWGARHGVTETSETPKALQLDKPPRAWFKYSKQPCSLKARVTQKRPNIRVEPEYRVYVYKDRVELEGDLKYTVHGKEVRELRVGMPGWECNVDPAGPDNLVNKNGVELTPSGTLLIPLAVKSTEGFNIKIRAQRPLEPEISSLSLPLPRPEANYVGPATVKIMPANNVELIPDSDKMSGLISQRGELSAELAGFQQIPFYYRGETAELVFAADVKIHGRSVTVDVSSEVSYREQVGKVEQTLIYNIEYEPLEEVTLVVPSDLAASDKMEVFWDGESLSMTDFNGQTDSGESSDPVTKRAVLTPPRDGRCELTIRYPIAGLKLQPQANMFPEVPLVMPGEGELRSNHLSVSAAAGIVVQSSSDGAGVWSAPSDGPGRYPESGVLELTASERANSVVLNVHLEDPDTFGSTVVQLAWIQTWLARNSRQDRAVFQFTSGRSRVELNLPADVDPNTLTILLDDLRFDAEPTSPGPLVIELPKEATSRPRRLEATYQFRSRKRDPGPLSVDLPSLGDEARVRRTYWQLVLPNAEHVIVCPAGLIPEFKWAWKGIFLGREMMEQPHLETLTGVSAQPPLNAATSRYLFSSLGPIQRCTLRTASRTSIVAVVSLTALAVGWTFIYFPLTRHPAMLLVLTIFLLGLTVLRPAPTFLFVQAASLGVGLTLFSALLHRGVARRYAWAVRREPSNLDYDKGSTEAEYGRAVEGSEVSTETTPPAISGPIAESNP